MSCKKCQGLVVEDHGEHRCLNCGARPYQVLITVKCSNPDCFAMPELNGYYAPCWHSRKRSTLTEAQKAKMYREKQRRANAAKRAKRAQRKEAMRDVHTIGTYAVGEESRTDYQNGTSLPAEAVSGMARSDGQGNQATM